LQGAAYLVKKSTKAALLSAFVFPGVGHIYLKKYMPGALLAGASFAAITYLMSAAVERVLQISDKIQTGDVQLDVDAIAELVSVQSSGADTLLINIATAAFIICWLAGIVDSCRVDCTPEKKQ
jgi:hypothetical protein